MAARKTYTVVQHSHNSGVTNTFKVRSMKEALENCRSIYEAQSVAGDPLKMEDAASVPGGMFFNYRFGFVRVLVEVK